MLFSSPAFPWKPEISKFLSSTVRNYQAAANYLIQSINTASTDDVPQMIIILSFCHASNGDSDSAFLQMKNYFENLFDRFNPKELDFLTRDLQIEISDYYNLWVQKYPLISNIIPDPSKLSFDQIISKTLSIGLVSLNQTSYSILKGITLIGSGSLIKGKNTVKLLDVDLEKSQTLKDYFIEVGTGDIRIRKNLIIEINTIIPNDVSLVNGKLSFKNLVFKEEKTSKTEYIKEKYFDKSFFLKNSIMNIGIAMVFTASDLAFFSPKQNEKPIYYSLHKFSQVFSVSISVFAAVNFFKSFKTRVSKNIIEQTDENAAKHNQLLQEKLDSIKPLIHSLVVIKASAI